MKKPGTAKPSRRGGPNAGSAIERRAEHWLRRQGLKPVARNYRCRLGEIDILMADGDTLVFIEVRFRSDHDFGDGAVSVTWHKQQKLIRAAEHFISRHPQFGRRTCRFDVIAAAPAASEGGIEFNWIKNAFWGR